MKIELLESVIKITNEVEKQSIMSDYIDHYMLTNWFQKNVFKEKTYVF